MVFMFVLVLVVVRVTRGDRDKLGIAERNEKTFLHYFYAICEILYSTRDAGRKKVYRNDLKVAKNVGFSLAHDDFALTADACLNQPVETTAQCASA